MGRKRSIITDTLGLLLAVLVTAAGVQDSTAGRPLLERAATDHPTPRKVWVDGGHRKHFVEHAAALGIDLEIVQRTPGTRGFTPIPKRWTAERTSGRLMLHRRLARDCKTLPARSKPTDPSAAPGQVSRAPSRSLPWSAPATNPTKRFAQVSPCVSSQATSS